ncbi:hypothetical protein CLU79DRAFT_892145 [Phycomyces nitens]|nr:hypothetical protein CLU79DRAFT_892145 [Phycomyces nitens]
MSTTDSTPRRESDGLQWSQVAAKTAHTKGKLNHRNAPTTLFTVPEYESLVTQDHSAAIWIINDHEFEKILTSQFPDAMNLITKFSKTGYRLARVLLSTVQSRLKDIITGIVVKNETILGSPGISTDNPLIRVNLYNIRLCRTNIELESPIVQAFRSFAKVAHIRVYHTINKLFCGEAMVLIDSILREVHLSGTFEESLGERESTLSETAIDESDYCESKRNSVYRLTFDELDDNSLKSSTSKYVLHKKQSTFQKRMELSSITLPPVEKILVLKRHGLSDGCYLMIRQFKRAVEETKPSIPADWIQSSDTFWPLLYCILTYALNTINIDQKHTHARKKHHIARKSEPNFITKYVSNFFQTIMFAYCGQIFFR